jgi:hypothetical protein
MTSLTANLGYVLIKWTKSGGPSSLKTCRDSVRALSDSRKSCWIILASTVCERFPGRNIIDEGCRGRTPERLVVQQSHTRTQYCGYINYVSISSAASPAASCPSAAQNSSFTVLIILSRQYHFFPGNSAKNTKKVVQRHKSSVVVIFIM